MNGSVSFCGYGGEGNLMVYARLREFPSPFHFLGIEGACGE